MRMRRIRWLLRVANFGKRMSIRQKKKTETRSDRLQQFLFETVFFLFARSFDNSRIKRRIKSATDLQKCTIRPSAGRRAFPLALLRPLKSPKVSSSLRGEEADHSVNSSPCALHSAVRNILRCNRSVLRHVLRRANRTRLNAANADSECENN